MKPAAFAVAIMILWTASASADLVDPTRPYELRNIAAEPIAQGPVLQATWVSEGKKSAVISGRNVKVGDTFDGAVVADIRPYEVVLSKGGRETRLRMLPKLNREKGIVE